MVIVDGDKMTEIFKDLFVLELANNHWGSLERGKSIVRQFAKVVKENNVKAAIKLQFRDVDNIIHTSYKKEGKKVNYKIVQPINILSENTVPNDWNEIVKFIEENENLINEINDLNNQISVLNNVVSYYGF